MWITPRLGNDPSVIHISASYDGSCQAQDPAQTLDDFGAINIGESYHLLISTNQTFTTVTIYSNDNGDPASPNIYPFPRAFSTNADHVGTTSNVYFMSGKASTVGYNRGNGTFSNIVITSKLFTAYPTAEPSPAPSLSPTNEPTTPTVNPTVDPSLSPTPAPTPEGLVIDTTSSPTPDGAIDTTVTPTPGTSTTNDNDGAKEEDDSVFIDGTTIAIIISVCSVCCCLCCGVCIAYKRTKDKSTPKFDYMSDDEIAVKHSTGSSHGA